VLFPCLPLGRTISNSTAVTNTHPAIKGLDGYTVGVGWNPIPQFQMYLDYDGLYDHSTLGSFALTQVGLTVVNSHMQEILTGSRFFLPGLWKGHGRVNGHRLIAYLDAGFGEARLHTELRQPLIGTVQAADTAFAWALGGGMDYRFIRTGRFAATWACCARISWNPGRVAYAWG
jgi:hypothetical protein